MFSMFSKKPTSHEEQLHKIAELRRRVLDGIRRGVPANRIVPLEEESQRLQAAERDRLKALGPAVLRENLEGRYDGAFDREREAGKDQMACQSAGVHEVLAARIAIERGDMFLTRSNPSGLHGEHEPSELVKLEMQLLPYEARPFEIADAAAARETVIDYVLWRLDHSWVADTGHIGDVVAAWTWRLRQEGRSMEELEISRPWLKLMRPGVWQEQRARSMK